MIDLENSQCWAGPIGLKGGERREGGAEEKSKGGRFEVEVFTRGIKDDRYNRKHPYP